MHFFLCGLNIRSTTVPHAFNFLVGFVIFVLKINPQTEIEKVLLFYKKTKFVFYFFIARKVIAAKKGGHFMDVGYGWKWAMGN